MCGYQIITSLQEYSETPLNIQSELLFLQKCEAD